MAVDKLRGRRFCTRALATIFLLATALVCWVAAGGLSQADDAIVTTDKGVCTVRSASRAVVRYQATPHPNRPYIAAWTTPAGRQILLDSPHDHPHHHALMYAIGIDDVDFWAEVPPEKYGRQVPVGDLSTRTVTSGGKTTTKLEQRLRWITPEGKSLAEEARTITVHEGLVPEASLLTWRFRLTPSPEHAAISLWGRHYFGLGLRMIPSMDRVGQFQFSGTVTSQAVRGTELLTRSAWCAYTAPVDGHPVTVAMFNDPQNPRSPATWFTMTDPFAYLGATLNLEHEKLSVSGEHPLTACYGVALWDGTQSKETIEAAYQRWLER